MKRSETPAESLAVRKAYIDLRWKQLSELSISWGDEAIKYLLFVNAGAMAGALSFIGAMPQIRQSQWPQTALSLFVLGVVLVGIYHAVRYHRTEWLFRGWRESVAAYSSDQLDWNDLLDGDAARSKKGNGPLLVLAYASLLCFMSGLLIAALNFHEITNALPKEVSHAGTQTTIAAPRAITATAPGAKTGPEREPPPAYSSAERPGTGPGSNAAAKATGQINSNLSWPVFTLYRNSVTDESMRIHVATFDASENEEYNRGNCEQALALFQAQPGLKVKFWCEKRRHKK